MYRPQEFEARKKFEEALEGFEGNPKGITVSREFTKDGKKPWGDWDLWSNRDASIKNSDGSIVFEQKAVWFPKAWSQTAVDITVQKYFRGKLGTEDRENSLEQMISRVIDTIARWGIEGNYFATKEDALAFRDELIYMIVHQYMAFNSPVWFNVGVDEKPQGSACYIISVEDSMESILDLVKTEGLIFKRGSGAGSNLSKIRGKNEGLASGGIASGPVSFMKGFDAFAGVIKSGGATRRSAKMVILDSDHPDIEEFVQCKVKEEKKAWDLIDAGYDGSFNVVGGAYDSVAFQNANHSVRVTDAFMEAVEKDLDWNLIARTDGRVLKTVRARELFRSFAEAAHACGDPGIQFHDTINRWNTCSNVNQIMSSNPCCFRGDTEILTSIGKKTINELMEMEDLPLAMTVVGGELLGKPINKVWQSGSTKELIYIKTDRDILISCTSDHVFFLADGEEKKAIDLKVRDSLFTSDSIPDSVAWIGKTVTTEETPVFDLEVDEVHTFAVSSPGASHGLVVHNSEYMFIDDTACNLASQNLKKFQRNGNDFDYKLFVYTTQLTITAMEILVGNASYPTVKIEENSHKYRTLGIGYANLGALIMSMGLAYDSDEARDLAAAITSLLSGSAYHMSTLLAQVKGKFEGCEAPMIEVLEKHFEASHELRRRIEINKGYLPSSPNTSWNIAKESEGYWDNAVFLAKRSGVRNAQISLLAPCGTIGFMMDCDTTGIEPELGLIKYKKLIGGGTIKIVNNTVKEALKFLGYDEDVINKILSWIDEHGSVKGCDILNPEHRSIFDCSFGENSIDPTGHVKMMAAVQPFLSGAISKTVNVPNSATIKDIENIYLQSWKLGLKAVAVYRDSCKRTQPLSTKKEESSKKEEKNAFTSMPLPARRRLPDSRPAITHKFTIGSHEGYLTVGLYDDGLPGEVFIKMAKEGSVVSGMADSFATAISMALQYGTPLQSLVDKFKGMKFEPSGFTQNEEIRMALSLSDYMARWLEIRFLKNEGDQKKEALVEETVSPSPSFSLADSDSPPCHECGTLMVRNGSCHRCANCGATSGCS